MVVATNLIRDYYRKAYKRRELLDEAEPYSSYDELDYCIDRYLDSLEMHELTNRMLKALHDRNADWYEVFVLVELLEVPRKSVAKERGIALSTVDAHLKKARMWMKEQYGAGIQGIIKRERVKHSLFVKFWYNIARHDTLPNGIQSGAPYPKDML